MRISIGGLLSAALVLLGAASPAGATTIFSLGPNPFPDGSVIMLSGQTRLCPVTNECVKLAVIRDIEFVSANVIPGGFEEALTADIAAELVDITTNTVLGTSELTLKPGTFFDVSITGGYNPFTNPVGTFPETIDALSVSGTGVLGRTIVANLAASPPSTGSVTISSAPGGFYIQNQIALYISATVDGQPFPVPPIHGAGAPAPEAPVWTMLLIGFGSMGSVMRHRRRAATEAV